MEAIRIRLNHVAATVRSQRLLTQIAANHGTRSPCFACFARVAWHGSSNPASPLKHIASTSQPLSHSQTTLFRGNASAFLGQPTYMYKLKRSRRQNLHFESLESRQLLDSGGLGDFLTSRGNRTLQVESIVENQTAADLEMSAIDGPSSVDEVALGISCEMATIQCVRAGDEAAFQATMSTPSAGAEPVTFYVFPDTRLDSLHIRDRQGDQLHFLAGARIIGSQQSLGAWNVDQGVVNIEGSSNLTITGMTVYNTFQYRVVNASGDFQTSTALNISHSDNIELRQTKLVSNGKSALWIQGNSTVTSTDAEIDCYYFCVGVAASDFSSTNLTANQSNLVVPIDVHPTMWVSSTMRGEDGTFYGGSNVTLHDTTVNRQSGRGMFTGNGGYDYRSNIRVSGTTTINRSGNAAAMTDAWLPLHQNYFGITLNLQDDYPQALKNVANHYALTGDFGYFVAHEFGSGGMPPTASPMIICIQDACLSSNDLLNGLVGDTLWSPEPQLTSKLESREIVTTDSASNNSSPNATTEVETQEKSNTEPETETSRTRRFRRTLFRLRDETARRRRG